MRRAWVVAVCAALAACHHVREVPMRPLPADAYAHYLSGRLAGYREDWPTAVDELTAAAKAAPDQPVIAVELAHALVKAKRTDDAKAVLATARAAWPDHPQVWLASGDLLAALALDASPGGAPGGAPGGTTDDAIGAYRRGIALAADDERGYLGLAKLLLARHDDAGALATLRALIAHVPASVDGHYLLAQRLAAGGDDEHATSELHVVLERDPDQIDARMDLAHLLRAHGQLADAIAQTRSAFDRAGQPLDLAQELFYLLCEADDRQGATDLLTLLDDDRSDPLALATVERFDLQLGRLAEAKDAVARIAAQDADAGLVARAALEAAGGDTAPNGEPAAVTTALAVAESSPQFSAARRVAADALIAAGKPARALEVLAAARAAKPNDLELAYAAAVATADTGAAGGAAAAALVAGTDVDHRLAQARLADHVHDARGALALLDPLVRANPKNAVALNLYGYLLADARQRLADAETYLHAARELSPGDPAILDSWGWLLLARGKTKDAIHALDQAQRYAPREPEILFHLAAAWAAGGSPKLAAELLAKADALHPPADVRKRMDDLRATLVVR